MRKPFFMKRCKAWYVWHNGKQVRLDADKEAAFQKYHELMAQGNPACSSDTVASLCNQYLNWCEKNRSEATYQNHRQHISSFIRFVGTGLRLENAKPLHLSNWLSEKSEWSATSKNTAARYVKRVFNWAVEEGRYTHNPVKNFQAPAPSRREAFVTRAQFDLLVATASDQNLQDYLTFLFETGARPQEIKLIESKHCDLKAKRIVLPASQAKGKRHARVIYFTNKVKGILARLEKLHPDGPLFRNSDDEPWNKNSVNCRFRRLRKKLASSGTPIDGLCATALRHGFATEALKNGVDPVTVSILMGHADASQVARTYQHLAADPEFLSAALTKATG